MMICLHWKELMFEQRLLMSQALEVTPSVSVCHHSAKELRTESVLGQPALFQVSHLQSLVWLRPPTHKLPNPFLIQTWIYAQSTKALHGLHHALHHALLPELSWLSLPCRMWQWCQQGNLTNRIQRVQTSQDAETTKKTTQCKHDESYAAFEGYRPTALQEKQHHPHQSTPTRNCLLWYL